MFMLLVAVFLGLQAADLALTLRGLAIGKRERNPLARLLMRHMGRVKGLVFLKVVTLLLTWVLLLELPRSWQIACIGVFSVLGLLVVINNAAVLRRAKTRGVRRSA